MLIQQKLSPPELLFNIIFCLLGNVKKILVENLIDSFSVYPSQPTSFRVKSKTRDSVTLSWKRPDLKNLPKDILEYLLECDHDNFIPGKQKKTLQRSVFLTIMVLHVEY